MGWQFYQMFEKDNTFSTSFQRHCDDSNPTAMTAKKTGLCDFSAFISIIAVRFHSSLTFWGLYHFSLMPIVFLKKVMGPNNQILRTINMTVYLFQLRMPKVSNTLKVCGVQLKSQA